MGGDQDAQEEMLGKQAPDAEDGEPQQGKENDKQYSRERRQALIRHDAGLGRGAGPFPVFFPIRGLPGGVWGVEGRGGGGGPPPPPPIHLQ